MYMNVQNILFYDYCKTKSRREGGGVMGGRKCVRERDGRDLNERGVREGEESKLKGRSSTEGGTWGRIHNRYRVPKTTSA